MTEKQWYNRIKKQCNEIGTYRKAFEITIKTLASLLSERDNAYEKYLADGGKSVVEYTNSAGFTNDTKNPKYQVWLELCKEALPYLRDLGLTAAGLKKIDEKAMKPQKKNALAEALKELG